MDDHGHVGEKASLAFGKLQEIEGGEAISRHEVNFASRRGRGVYA